MLWHKLKMWWRKFRWNWIPSGGQEWGIFGCLGIFLVIASLLLILFILTLLAGISWVWSLI